MHTDHRPPDEPEPAAPRAPPHGVREQLGEWIGRLWAPAIAQISRARHARMFHPDGLTFAGRVSPVDSEHAELARALDGRVLVRCAAALWRGGVEHLDVLGFALRVRRGDGPALDERAEPGDQDLLFATIRSPFTMLLSPLFTDASDFVDQRYWAVCPFAHGGRRYELRISPVAPPPRPALKQPRAARLLAAVHAHRAMWRIEAREPWTLQRWRAVAHVVLERPVTIEQAALAFEPFRNGLGIVPVGLVHAIRRTAYAASRAGRADDHPPLVVDAPAEPDAHPASPR
ncbi:MAG TPA: hypothetical protein VFP84_24695 [Kofleriaceae bacterium]|nr:hypothetical protein [Kofleriaceae bacterium]